MQCGDKNCQNIGKWYTVPKHRRAIVNTIKKEKGNKMILWAFLALIIALLGLLFPALTGCAECDEDGDATATTDAAPDAKPPFSSSFIGGIYELKWRMEQSSICDKLPVMPDRLELQPAADPGGKYWLAEGCDKPTMNSIEVFFAENGEALIMPTVVRTCTNEITSFDYHFIRWERDNISSVVIARPAGIPCSSMYELEGIRMPY